MIKHLHILYTEHTKTDISTQAFSSTSAYPWLRWQQRRLGNKEFFRRQASYAQAEEALREECRRERWAHGITGLLMG